MCSRNVRWESTVAYHLNNIVAVPKTLRFYIYSVPPVIFYLEVVDQCDLLSLPPAALARSGASGTLSVVETPNVASSIEMYNREKVPFR